MQGAWVCLTPEGREQLMKQEVMLTRHPESHPVNLSEESRKGKRCFPQPLHSTMGPAEWADKREDK